MDRRKFLRNSSLAGAILSTSIPSGLQNFKDEFDLNEVTIDELQQKMKEGKLNAAGITQKYLQRIKTVDQQGPSLHAVIEINPDALSIAASLDRERKQGKIRGPLHGIPFLIKDNISTADKMMTTAGSLALLGNIMLEEAFIIKKLREAGAVIMGKTNLSEWANFRSSRSTSGWSSRGGQTRCPYVLDRNPSGSSSGSGAATAANLCAISIGTETDGSIVSPSSVNGLVGIKPTVGLWSRTGIIPISATQDTAGPIARTVRDAAILLGPLAGPDSTDPVTLHPTTQLPVDYAQFLDPHGIQGKTIGIESAHLKGHEGVVALYNAAIEILKKSGATVVEIDLLKKLNEIGSINQSEFLVLQYEFKDGLNKYLAGSQSKVRTLAEIIAFNKSHEAAVMPYFKQETLIDSDAKGGLQSEEYKDTLAKTLLSRTIIENLMLEHHLDAISGVTNGPACCIDLVAGDYDTGFSFSTPAAIAGFPHITVPMGQINELPIGLSFMGRPYTEPQLLSIAYAYEQATHLRRPPAFMQRIPT
jgi:amidase